MSKVTDTISNVGKITTLSRNECIKEMIFELYIGDSKNSMMDGSLFNQKNTILKYKKPIKLKVSKILPNTIILCTGDIDLLKLIRKDCTIFNQFIIKISYLNGIIYKILDTKDELVSTNKNIKYSFNFEIGHSW